MSVDFLRQKTFWAGVSAIIAAWAGYFCEGVTIDQAVGATVFAVQGIFLRQGIAKIEGTK